MAGTPEPVRSLVIVTGCPGSGKTTLSRILADAHPRGLHLPSDVFYDFPARLIEPTDPASQQQNETIMKALGRATAAFLEGGYHVFLEGIVGPWFLPTVLAELPVGTETSYVVLRLPEAEALRRVRQRRDASPSLRVAPMVRAFQDLGAFETHAISTLDRDTGALYELVRSGLAEGRFRLGSPA